MNSTMASTSGSANFCGGMPDPGVTLAGSRKCERSQSGQRRAPTRSSSGPILPPTAQLVAAAAADRLKEVLAPGEHGSCRVVGGFMALAAGGLDILKGKHGLVPMGDIAMCILGSGRPSLTAMADRAAKLLEGMLVVLGMVGQRLRDSAVARILNGQMAGRAPVDAVELGQEDLAHLDGYPAACICWSGVDARRISSCDELLLVVLPRTVFVAVVSYGRKHADEEARGAEPSIEFSEGSVVHVSAPLLLAPGRARVLSSPSSAPGRTFRLP